MSAPFGTNHPAFMCPYCHPSTDPKTPKQYKSELRFPCPAIESAGTIAFFHQDLQEQEQGTRAKVPTRQRQPGYFISEEDRGKRRFALALEIIVVVADVASKATHPIIVSPICHSRWPKFPRHFMPLSWDQDEMCCQTTKTQRMNSLWKKTP